MRRSVFIKTFGCQMNAVDSARRVSLLPAAESRPADTLEEADLVLLNTCSIREKADQKIYSDLGTLRRWKQRRPARLAGEGGRMAQPGGKRGSRTGACFRSLPPGRFPRWSPSCRGATTSAPTASSPWCGGGRSAGRRRGSSPRPGRARGAGGEKRKFVGKEGRGVPFPVSAGGVFGDQRDPPHPVHHLPPEGPG